MAHIYKNIYNEIKKIIPTTYATKFNSVDETYVVNGVTTATTKTTVMYFKEAIDGHRVVDSGQFVTEYVRVVFNIYADRTSTETDNCMEYCEAIKEALNTTFNKEVIDSETGVTIRILEFLLSGNINTVGRNGQGVPVYSINFKVKYSKVR